MIAVSVEWDGNGRGISARIARLGTRGRRALALGATALIAAAAATILAESPSTGTAPHTVTLPCEHSSTPRVFVGVPSRYAAIAVRAPKCP